MMCAPSLSPRLMNGSISVATRMVPFLSAAQRICGRPPGSILTCSGPGALSSICNVQ